LFLFSWLLLNSLCYLANHRCGVGKCTCFCRKCVAINETSSHSVAHDDIILNNTANNEDTTAAVSIIDNESTSSAPLLFTDETNLAVDSTAHDNLATSSIVISNVTAMLDGDTLNGGEESPTNVSLISNNNTVAENTDESSTPKTVVNVIAVSDNIEHQNAALETNEHTLLLCETGKILCLYIIFIYYHYYYLLYIICIYIYSHYFLITY